MVRGARLGLTDTDVMPSQQIRIWERPLAVYTLSLA